MGAMITSMHEIDAVLSAITDMAIQLVGGEVGALLLDDGGTLKPEVSWGVRESFVKSVVYDGGQDVATHCFNTRKTVVLSDLSVVTTEGMSLQSVIAAPITQSDTCLGVMVVINKSDGGNYTEEDRELLEMLLNFVAVAIENSRLMKDRLNQQKIRQEMAVAKQIQKALLAEDLEHVPGVEIGAVYFPARDVGGDFYDVIRIAEAKFIAVLGDVSSKGVPAAMVMSALSGVLRLILRYNPGISISDLASALNNTIARDIIRDRDMFVTMFFARFDLEDMKLVFCNAGHLPGLLWEHETETVRELSAGGPIVGQFPHAVYQETERDLASGDRLFLFTDGLTEAVDSDDNLLGRERVAGMFAALTELSPGEFCHRVKEWVDRYTRGADEDTHDDFAILQIKVE
jgi:sigma-B regulation protein RsbU (phosphoserine phosphatase)